MTSTQQIYEYRDGVGEPLFRVIRRGHGDAKQFHAERFDGAGWVSGTGDVSRVLYRLPEVLAAVQRGQRVYVVEGEKDADTLAGIGLFGTTNPFGAGKWDACFAESLTGADVVVIPDRDEKGHMHAADVARSLAGVALSVRLLELDGPEKSDVTDFFERGGTREQLEALADAAIPLRHDSSDSAGPLEADDFLTFLTGDELLLRNPPEWLIDGVLPARALGILFGSPGSGKTFAAIDAAHCIAYGLPWHGRRTRQGSVVVIAAEGHAGALGQRDAAWRAYHRRESASSVRYYCESVQLIERPAVARLVKSLNRDGKPPVLLIVDTFARCTENADENSSTDMKQAVGAASRIIAETGAAVLLVHHTRKSDGVLRGSSVLSGAADTVIFADKARGDGVELRCDKQKEAPRFEPITLRLQSFGASAVLVDGGHADGQGGRMLNENDHTALAALSSEGMGHAEWLRASGLPEGTFNRVPARLERAGRVVKRERKYFPVRSITTTTPTALSLLLSPVPSGELPLTPIPLEEGMGGGAPDAVAERWTKSLPPRLVPAEEQGRRGVA